MKKTFSFFIVLTLVLTNFSFLSINSAQAAELIINGGFETPLAPSGGWDIYPSGTADLGWIVEWYGGSTSYGGQTRPEPANLELHRGVLGNAHTDSQYAELDTDWNGHVGSFNNEPASVKIYQKVETCLGGEYTLSYAWSPRPNHSNNQMDVLVDGSSIDNHSGAGSGSPVWHEESHLINGTGGLVEIAFIETATPNSLGMFLDSVSLTQTNECPPPAIGLDKQANKTEVYIGEDVTYTYTATNEGYIDLENVDMSDNFCSPVYYASGDDGDDKILSLTETWTYTCTTTLTETTTNVATITAEDEYGTQVQDTAQATVAVKGPDCTLTQGYWKTHSINGPAPYDSDWSNLEDNKLFYKSDQTYYEVINTAPKGNVYYILAHQFIAAELNKLTPEIYDTWSAAQDLFGKYTPAEATAFKGKTDKEIRQEFTSLAGELADYNEGITGPGHCSQQDYELVDTLNVDANSNAAVYSGYTLELGKSYLIEAVGTAFAGDTIDFDAKYSLTNRISGDDWTDPVSGYVSYGSTLLDLKVNNTFVNWGSYNNTHIYSIPWAGADAPVSFVIYDIYYPNNTGSLTVNIYEL